MKILTIIFLISFVLFFLFGNIRVNDMPSHNVFQRAKICIYGSALITLVIGLPILGIIYLIGGLL